MTDKEKINAGLWELIAYVNGKTYERGLRLPPEQEILKFISEVGEFVQAHNERYIPRRKTKKVPNLELEAADVLFTFIKVCQREGIDLVSAFWKKEKKNARMKWE